MQKHYSSIIRLKPEYAERYKALHRNTFPGVLKRIALSNIENYGIFLHEDILFSYYDYVGNNITKDLADMADEVTRDWWRLTDPMQEPFPDRKDGEWWASCNDLLFYDNSVNSNKQENSIKRKAFICNINTDYDDLKNIFTTSFLVDKDFYKRLLITYRNGLMFFYVEYCSNHTKENKIAKQISNALKKCNLNTELKEMTEVFYTDIKKETETKKVFVSGCFDMLHSGHVAFISEASSYGNLYVCIGSDNTILQLKGRYPINTQEERQYMIKALKNVYDCRINKGSGILDFLQELDDIKPDIFVVNEDGNTPQKAQLCKERGIEYKVLQRIPHSNLPRRSTTDLRKECTIPFRIDLAGGWLDQPWVSKLHPGPVITISIEPTIEFNHRSGMSTSTRNKAIELWQTEIPSGNREQLAKILFTYENPPGTEFVSGSQDSIGIVFPFLNKLNYNADYWPESIETTNDEKILQWIEDVLFLIPLGPRKTDYYVLNNTNITAEGAKQLSDAAEMCWKAIHDMDIDAFGKYFQNSFKAQISMFPNMVDNEILEIIEQYSNKAKGWKLSGAGGGGYLIFVSDKPIEGAVKIKIRRG